MAVEPPAAWSRAQRILHWSLAVLVLVAAPMGLIMVALPFRALLLKFVLYQLHKTIGILAFLLGLAQLALHGGRGRPAPDAGIATWQRRAARWMHAALFALLVVTPLLGYLTAASAPARIPTLFLGVLPVPHVIGTDAAWFAVLRQLHLAAAAALAALAFGHAVAALYHHWQGHDTLRRMWRGGRIAAQRTP